MVVLFLKAGVPLNKLEEFREVLEQNAHRLDDKRGMYDLITFVFEKEQNTIKAVISGKNVYVVFYGTLRIGEALAVIIQCVDNWKVVQRLKSYVNSLIFSLSNTAFLLNTAFMEMYLHDQRVSESFLS